MIILPTDRSLWGDSDIFKLLTSYIYLLYFIRLFIIF